MTNPEQYGKDILSGKVSACEYVRLSVQRHFDDLEKDWGYYFDEEAGMRPVKFFNLLVLYEGDKAGEFFTPEPWQAWILYVVFGWKRKEDDKRRFKYAYIETPRKNGKTTFTAGAALYHLLMDGENAPHIYFVATKYAQALECLDDAVGIANKTPELKKRLVLYKTSIDYPMIHGSVNALGYNPLKMDGMNPSLVVLDEFHAHPDDGMFVKMKTAFGQRSQGLVLMVTTAGSNRNGVCYDYRDWCTKVLDPNVDAEQDNMFSIIYTIDEGDDWKDESSWVKANPSWPILEKIEFKDEAKEAIDRATAETSFKNLRLNIWTDINEVWLKTEEWQACEMDPPIEDVNLIGLPCWAGADFAETKDLCSLVLNFKLTNGHTYTKYFFWIPSKKVREQEDRVDYWPWKKAGYVRVIEGDAINHEELAIEVAEILHKYQAKGLTYDKYGIGEAVIQSMINDGYPLDRLHPIKQTTTFFQGPIVCIEERIGIGEFRHDGSPVMAWNISNTEVFYDSYGGKKFVKSKARNKIDGSVALAMSIREELDAPPLDDGTGGGWI